MANVENLEAFKNEYTNAFDTDWIERLDWKNIAKAQISCDSGRRLIHDIKRQAFVCFAKSMLSGEYIDSLKEVNSIHSEMTTYWEQEHLSLPEKDSQISNLKANLMQE